MPELIFCSLLNLPVWVGDTRTKDQDYKSLKVSGMLRVGFAKGRNEQGSVMRLEPLSKSNGKAEAGVGDRHGGTVLYLRLGNYESNRSLIFMVYGKRITERALVVSEPKNIGRCEHSGGGL